MNCFTLTGPKACDFFTRDTETTWLLRSAYTAKELNNTSDVRQVDDELVWRMMIDAAAAGELLCCTTFDINRDSADDMAVGGLTEKHAHTILEVGRVVAVQHHPSPVTVTVYCTVATIVISTLLM
jgi:hypothetical protein